MKVLYFVFAIFALALSKKIPQVPENFFAKVNVSSMGLTLSGDYWRSFQYGVDKIVSTSPFPSTTIEYFKCDYKVTVDNCQKESLNGQEMYSMQIPPLATYQGEEIVNGKTCDHWFFALPAVEMDFYAFNDTTINQWVIRKFKAKMDSGFFQVEFIMELDHVKPMDFSEEDIVNTFCTTENVCPTEAPHTMKDLKNCDHDIFPPVKDEHAIFVLDVSGSMSESQKTKEGTFTRLDILKKQMDKVLRKLQSSQSFNIIRFSDSASPWKSETVKATSENIEEAISYVKSLTAGGSTNAYDALQSALLETNVEGVYFLSDGEPNKNPSEILNMVKNLEAKLEAPVKVHATVFYGGEKASSFMKSLSELTGGIFTDIQEGNL